MDHPHFCLELEQCFRIKNWIQFLEHIATIHPEKHRPLTRAIRHAQLDRDVAVLGTGDYLEIWDRATWESENERAADRVTELTARFDHPS